MRTIHLTDQDGRHYLIPESSVEYIIAEGTRFKLFVTGLMAPLVIDASVVTAIIGTWPDSEMSCVCEDNLIRG